MQISAYQLEHVQFVVSYQPVIMKDATHRQQLLFVIKIRQLLLLTVQEAMLGVQDAGKAVKTANTADFTFVALKTGILRYIQILNEIFRIFDR